MILLFSFSIIWCIILPFCVSIDTPIGPVVSFVEACEDSQFRCSILSSWTPLIELSQDLLCSGRSLEGLYTTVDIEVRSSKISSFGHSNIRLAPEYMCYVNESLPVIDGRSCLSFDLAPASFCSSYGLQIVDQASFIHPMLDYKFHMRRCIRNISQKTDIVFYYMSWLSTKPFDEEVRIELLGMIDQVLTKLEDLITLFSIVFVTGTSVGDEYSAVTNRFFGSKTIGHFDWSVLSNAGVYNRYECLRNGCRLLGTQRCYCPFSMVYDAITTMDSVDSDLETLHSNFTSTMSCLQSEVTSWDERFDSFNVTERIDSFSYFETELQRQNIAISFLSFIKLLGLLRELGLCESQEECSSRMQSIGDYASTVNSSLTLDSFYNLVQNYNSEIYNTLRSDYSELSEIFQIGNQNVNPPDIFSGSDLPSWPPIQSRLQTSSSAESSFLCLLQTSLVHQFGVTKSIAPFDYVSPDTMNFTSCKQIKYASSEYAVRSFSSCVFSDLEIIRFVPNDTFCTSFEDFLVCSSVSNPLATAAHVGLGDETPLPAAEPAYEWEYEIVGLLDYVQVQNDFLFLRNSPDTPTPVQISLPTPPGPRSEDTYPDEDENCRDLCVVEGCDAVGVYCSVCPSGTSATCSPCPSGYYCPSDVFSHSCGNGQSGGNITYTETSWETEVCPFVCSDPGWYKDGNFGSEFEKSCLECPYGWYSPAGDNKKYICNDEHPRNPFYAPGPGDGDGCGFVPVIQAAIRPFSYNISESPYSALPLSLLTLNDSSFFVTLLIDDLVSDPCLFGVVGGWRLAFSQSSLCLFVDSESFCIEFVPPKGSSFTVGVTVSSSREVSLHIDSVSVVMGWIQGIVPIGSNPDFFVGGYLPLCDFLEAKIFDLRLFQGLVAPPLSSYVPTVSVNPLPVSENQFFASSPPPSPSVSPTILAAMGTLEFFFECEGCNNVVFSTDGSTPASLSETSFFSQTNHLIQIGERGRSVLQAISYDSNYGQGGIGSFQIDVFKNNSFIVDDLISFEWDVTPAGNEFLPITSLLVDIRSNDFSYVSFFKNLSITISNSSDLTDIVESVEVSIQSLGVAFDFETLYLSENRTIVLESQGVEIQPAYRIYSSQYLTNISISETFDVSENVVFCVRTVSDSYVIPTDRYSCFVVVQNETTLERATVIDTLPNYWPIIGSTISAILFVPLLLLASSMTLLIGSKTLIWIFKRKHQEYLIEIAREYGYIQIDQLKTGNVYRLDPMMTFLGPIPQ